VLAAGAFVPDGRDSILAVADIWTDRCSLELPSRANADHVGRSRGPPEWLFIDGLHDIAPPRHIPGTRIRL
jgi:hypothetical protein